MSERDAYVLAIFPSCVPNWERNTLRLYIVTTYLTYMQSTSCKMLSWIKHKRNQGCWEKYEQPQICRLMAESEEELKSLLTKMKEESEKVGLKLNIQNMKIMASGPITSWQIDGETMETLTDFILEGLQNHCRWCLQP